MLQINSKLSLNKIAVLITASIVISGCQTTSQSDQSANSSPAPIASTSSDGSTEKGLSHNKLMSIAARAWERGNASTALRLYNMAAQKKPNDVSPYLEMAKILRKTKRIDAALEIYNRLLEHQPNLVEAHIGIGYILLDQNKPYLSAQSFEAAVLIDPKNARSLGGMAVALDTAGEHDKAQDYYRLAIKSDTNNLIYQNNLALSLALVGRLDQAIAMFEIITAHPNAVAQHRQNLALVYGMAGKSADAMRYSRMDLNENDARNNALYFQALNTKPETSLSEEEGQAMVMKNEKYAVKRSLNTSRQPYEPLIARTEYSELSTQAVPATDVETPSTRPLHQNQRRYAHTPLTVAQLTSSVKTTKPASQNVAAAPLLPIIKSELETPKFARKTREERPIPSYKKEEKTVAVQKAIADPTQTYFAQLGSYRSVERAKHGWSILLKSHPDLLADFQPVFTKADLGPEKGIFYRVRVGAFNSKKTPLELCQTLRNRAQGCYLPVLSKNSTNMIQKSPETNNNVDEDLRKVNLKGPAPSGASFLISYHNERSRNNQPLDSTIASF